MSDRYSVTVENIGTIGAFKTKTEAVMAAREAVSNYARAHGPWHVIDTKTGELIEFATREDRLLRRLRERGVPLYNHAGSRHVVA